MNKEALIEALNKLDSIHEIVPQNEVACLCGFQVNESASYIDQIYELRTHIRSKQIEALVPLIGKGIAEAIGSACHNTVGVYCDVECTHEQDAQTARDWKSE